MSYTPGPWIVRQVLWKGNGWYIVAGKQEQIQICSSNRIDLASKEDSRLIASAPDLLEACKELLKEGSFRPYHFPGEKVAIRENPAVTKAKQAIERAEGKGEREND